MCNRKTFLLLFVCTMVTFGVTTDGFCFFGKKELERETRAVTLVREVERGGYKLVTTDELKGWIDESKGMLIVDTMPYEDSYQKNHIPGAAQF